MVESGVGLLVDGLSERLAHFDRGEPDGLPRVTAEKVPNRKGKLMALGNAIVPQIAMVILSAVRCADDPN